MSIAFEIAISELGSEASGGLDELLKRRYGSRQIVEYAYGDYAGWDEIAEGGWDLLGASEEQGGAGLGMRDLIAVAKTVGRWAPPLPIVETIMAKRWSQSARESDSAVTVAVTTKSGRILAPFGGTEGVRLLLDSRSGGIGEATTICQDDYAPCLRVSEQSTATAFGPEQAGELAIIWAAESVGNAERMLDIAVDYVKQRQQFGQPVGKFQAVKHHLADALKCVQEAESAVIWAAADAPLITPALEVAFDSALRAAEIGVQAHGGMGFTWELGLHVYLRQIVTLRQLSLSLTARADAS